MRKVVFLVVLFFLVVSLVRNIIDYQRNLSFYDQTKENYADALTKNKDLKVEMRAGSSPFEIEKSLRNKQNMLRKGEIIVIVPSPSPFPTPIILPTEAPYRQWIQLFFE